MYVARRGFSGIVQDLSSAITRMEGTNPAYNNPGALRSGPGQVGTAPNGIAIFPNYATGEAALENQVQLNLNRGLTLQQFFAGQRDASGNVIPGGYAGYAPAADSNQPNVYTADVSKWTGLPSDVPLNQISGAASSSDAPSPGVDDSSVVSLPDFFSSLDPVTVGIALGIVVFAVVLSRG